MKKMLVMMLTLAMIFTMIPAANAATQQDSDLVAYWTFDELTADGSVVDMTGNGNNLIMVDTAYAIVDGFSGKTFDFNGGTSAYDNSKHLVMSSDDLANQINGASGVTFSYFMKKEVLGSGTNFTMFAFKPGMDGVMAYAQPKVLAVNSRSGAAGNAVSTATTVDAIYSKPDDLGTKDAWMHVALVLDYAGDNVKIFVDGLLVGEEQTEDAPQTFATDVASYKTDVNDIATGWFGVGGRHVRVDDFKIYKRALTDDEIKESVPPVMSYDFEEVCDGTIKDSSANQMHITVDSTDSPEVIDGVQGKTIALTKTAYFPNDTFAGMLYGAKQFSVSTWVRLPEGTGAVANTELNILNEEVNTASTKAKGFALAVKGRNAYFGLRSRNSNRAPDNSISYVQAENVRSMHGDKEWRHLYIEADLVNKTGKVYWDGVLAKTIKTTTMESNLGLYYMGLTADGTPDTLNLYYMGTLSGQPSAAPIHVDSMNIYRRTLTENEIKRAAGEAYVFNQTESSVTANCFAENIDGIKAGNQVVFARYDGTMLKDCAIATVETVNDALTLNLDEIDVPANYTYKLFTLDSFNTLTPFGTPVNYTAQ